MIKSHHSFLSGRESWGVSMSLKMKYVFCSVNSSTKWNFVKASFCLSFVGVFFCCVCVCVCVCVHARLRVRLYTNTGRYQRERAEQKEAGREMLSKLPTEQQIKFYWQIINRFNRYSSFLKNASATSSHCLNRQQKRTCFKDLCLLSTMFAQLSLLKRPNRLRWTRQNNSHSLIEQYFSVLYSLTKQVEFWNQHKKQSVWYESKNKKQKTKQKIRRKRSARFSSVNNIVPRRLFTFLQLIILHRHWGEQSWGTHPAAPNKKSSFFFFFFGRKPPSKHR